LEGKEQRHKLKTNNPFRGSGSEMWWRWKAAGQEG